MARKFPKLGVLLGRLLCLMGFHDFRVLEVRFGFSANQSVEKVECRRCELVTTRRAQD